MRALRIDGPSSVELVEVQKPVPSMGEVLVRVAYAGICATDRKLAGHGSDVPRIPGHEATGWLEDGTPVGIHPDVGCGACRHCRLGFENRCQQRVAIGLDRDGAMAEWVAVPDGHALPLTGSNLDVLALLEPLACCVHATSLLDVREGIPALVVGAGPMGILAMWALQAEGAQVAVCETSAPRRDSAAELGADAVIDPEVDPASVLDGAPRVGVVTAPGSKPLSWALERMEPGGKVHVFAGSPGGNEIDVNVIHYKHLALVGSTGSTLHDYQRAHSLVIEGRVGLSRMPRKVISPEEAVTSLRTPEEAPDHRFVIDMGRSSLG